MSGLDHLEPLRDAIVRVVDIHSSPFALETPGVGSQFIGILQGLYQVGGGATPEHVAGWVEDRESPAVLHLHFISAGLYTQVEVRSGAKDMLVHVRAAATIAAAEFPTVPVPRVHTRFAEWDAFVSTAMNLMFADGQQVKFPATAFGPRGRSFEGFKDAVVSSLRDGSNVSLRLPRGD